jgi:hypothetical protein
MVETAHQFLTDENMKSALDNVRQRIHKNATDYEIDPANVFPAGDLPQTTAPGAGTQIAAPPPGAATPRAPVGTPPRATAAKAPASGGKASPGPEWQMINGVLHHNGQPY